MNIPVPTNRPYRAQGLLQSCVAISLALSPAIGTMRHKQNARTATAGEYHRSQAKILATIESAARDRDMATLRRIDEKYSKVLADPAYCAAIGSAIARVRAREARDQLAFSRKLNISRHRSEVSFRPDLQSPQLTSGELASTDRLSALPR